MSEEIDLSPLIFAVENMIEQIGDAAMCKGEERPTPDRLEKMAKSVTAQLKAIADIEQHNLRARQFGLDKEYTRYEDLPPPSPEERSRIAARFKEVVGQLAAGLDVPDHPAQTPPE